MTRTFSATHSGLQGVAIEIEASLQKALPAVVITGLPGDIVRESRERVRACLNALGFDIPSKRAVVHLSPAAEKKQGAQLDLGIAIALLAEERVLKSHARIAEWAFLGELSLDGRIRPVRSVLALVEALVADPAIRHIVIPVENWREAALLASAKLHPCSNLPELIRILQGEEPLPEIEKTEISPPQMNHACLKIIEGQALAKRALQIAVAGHHHLLLTGPPGVGKSLLAHAARTLLPPLEREELIDLVKHRGTFDEEDPCFGLRPFRDPHHSISPQGLLGGGSGVVSCGEVTLANGGILFLDELPEFRKDALEGLREPLQTGEIHLGRVGARVKLPARFLLIAAMNPCPCGYSFESGNKCVCPPNRPKAYRSRISGPLYDRIDLSVILGMPAGLSVDKDPSEDLGAKIESAHRIQRERFGLGSFYNGDAEVDLQKGPFALDTAGLEWVSETCRGKQVSYRSIHKTIRISRTIADLESAECIGIAHLREAWQLRCRDLSTHS